MVLKAIKNTLLLSTLLGCSTNSDFKTSEYIKSSTASPEVEIIERDYLSSLQFVEQTKDPFRGRRVSLMYETGPLGGGPTRGDRLYSRPIPVDEEFFNGVYRELEGRGAYVKPHGVFGGDYLRDLTLSRMPGMSIPDVTVIADRNPDRFDGKFDEVYIAFPEGNKYSFREVKRND